MPQKPHLNRSARAARRTSQAAAAVRPDKGAFRRVRLILLLIMLLAGFAGLIIQLLRLQIFQSSALATMALAEHRAAKPRLRRGTIEDRNGIPLAQDTLTFEIYAHPAALKRQGVPIALLSKRLAHALKLSASEIADMLNSDLPTVTLARNVTKDTMESLKASPLEPDLKVSQVIGLDFVPRWSRRYPQGSLAAHVLGFVNDEKNVVSGMEATAHTRLETPVFSRTEPSTMGPLQSLTADRMTPEALASIAQGKPLRLTLDARLQFETEQALADGLKKAKAKSGVALAMVPATGQMLAFATLPAYDPERFWKFPQSQLKNWAVSDVYPPGSTMKILTITTGLEAGVIDKDSKILDTGKMRLAGWTIKNYDYHKHPYPGLIDLKYLFLHSSNIGSAKVAIQVPKQVYYEQLKRFGLGQETGLQLPAETAGILPPPDQWDLSMQANLGFGYSLATTPVQLAAAVNAIANNGVWVPPRLISSNDLQLPRPHRAVSAKTSAIVRQVLSESFAAGKPKDPVIQSLRVAGKTGTSRKPNANGHGYSNSLYTSFVGFFPAEAPKILIMVVVDSPTMAEAWGSTVALPIFNAMAKSTVSLIDIDKLPAPKGLVSSPVQHRAVTFPKKSAEGSAG
ncbi:MAG: penicillin-binding protein 2 [Vampirovibrionales bacterium]|nr:penicillin-binding protein 2 [Vampirovibrionales bacterium]